MGNKESKTKIAPLPSPTIALPKPGMHVVMANASNINNTVTKIEDVILGKNNNYVALKNDNNENKTTIVHKSVLQNANQYPINTPTNIQNNSKQISDMSMSNPQQSQSLSVIKNDPFSFYFDIPTTKIATQNEIQSVVKSVHQQTNPIPINQVILTNQPIQVIPVSKSNPTNPVSQPNPINPASQSNPINPINQSNPINPASQSNPINPINQSNPINPASQSNPINPASQSNPVNPVSQSNPINSVSQPKPVNPVSQSNPVNPIDTYFETILDMIKPIGGIAVPISSSPKEEKKREIKKQYLVEIDTQIEDEQKGIHEVKFILPEHEFVRMFADPSLETKLNNIYYLVGYKMVYVVDAYRKRIPGVIAIVTLKIDAHENTILKSENNKSKTKTDHYQLVNLSNRLDMEKCYNQDEQANSLRYAGGDMIAWEHSTKYCAKKVEPLAITFLGTFRDVIRACIKYDSNMAFAESAFTYEELLEPVIYEVGKKNVSNREPYIGKGGCLDYFHFFLRPEYAIDYGFWQFKFASQKNDVNMSDVVIAKHFSTMRKVNYSQCKDNIRRKRQNVSLIKQNNGYVSSQVLANYEREKRNNNDDAFERDLLSVISS